MSAAPSDVPADSAPQASPEVPADSAPQASPEVPADSAPQASPEFAPASSLLRQHPDVVDVITFRTRDREPVQTVIAVATGPLASVVDLRDHLWETLDPADLPDVLVAVGDLPGTGGIDAALVEADLLDQPGCFTFRPARTSTELSIASVWREVLGRSRVGADDNFLDLGGDSMTAALLLDLTNERLGSELSLNDLLAAPSLAAVARTIDESAVAGDGHAAG